MHSEIALFTGTEPQPFSDYQEHVQLHKLYNYKDVLRKVILEK